MSEFIVFEGGEGAGKTVQIKGLERFLNNLGRKSFLTREPGGTQIGKQLRALVMHSDANYDPLTELLMYSGDRNEHVKNIIRPNLEKGDVLCDRYFFSTMAYQGYARGFDLDKIRTLSEWVTGGLMPDMTFFLDVDPEEGIRRAWAATQKEGHEHDRFEREMIDFHHKVRKGYIEVMEEVNLKYPDSFIRIDANQDMTEVTADIIYEFLQRTGKK